MSQVEYRRLIEDAVLSGEQLVEAVFRGRVGDASLPWREVTLRPVDLKGKRHIQFTYLESTRAVTKNYAGREIKARLDELLALPFNSIQAKTTRGATRIQLTKKGKAIVHSQKHAEPLALDMAHDRAKAHLLPEDSPDPFLRALGITTEAGQVRASQRRKFRQINHFLQLLEDSGELDRLPPGPVHMVDFGCGSAHLTFAAYHYLRHVRGQEVALTGVDVRGDLLADRQQLAEKLGFSDLTFEATPILDYRPSSPPDVVLALHACDTATDDALAQGIWHKSRLIVSVPCCHHHLHHQLARRSAPPPLQPVNSHAILQRRLGDILTDTFRAQILRIMGYQADVIQFIATTETDRNLMIRAVRQGEPGDAAVIAAYREMKAFWGVTPYLETKLAEALSTFLDEG